MNLVIKKTIKNRLPSLFVVEIATPAMWFSLPYKEEQALVCNSVEKRKKEFSAGRSCVRTALKEFGIHRFPLLADSERVPLWPDNIIGSISHTDDFCLAVVARKGEFKGIGIDVECIQRDVSEIKAMVCVERELKFLAGLSNKEEQLKYLILIFSAKESVYKALYPSMRIPFGFNDLEVVVNTYTECFDVEILSDMGVYPRLIGKYIFFNKYVFTSCEYLI